MGRDNILRDIFFDKHKHWDKFISKYEKRIRPIVIKEVEKFRICGQKEAGFTLFACPVCGEMKMVPHTCKGRFCTSCATGYTQEWSRETSRRMYRVPHRHIMFTLDERLWEIFNRHRGLMKDMMDLAVKILLEWMHKRGKVKSGAMVGLHTFGAQMNINPHVHYGPPNKNGNGSIEAQVGYIGRYMRRPAMAVSRILEYDGEKVTFKHFDKTEQKEKLETITVEEFIARIVKHIPDEQFKTIRYYGIYSRRGKKLADKMMEAYQSNKKKKIGSQRKQQRVGRRDKLKEFTGKDPLECSRCKEIMEYKGKVCLKAGVLVVGHAIDDFARKRIKELAGIDEPSKQKKNEPQKEESAQGGWQSSQICLFAV